MISGVPLLLSLLTFLAFVCLLQGVFWWLADPARRHHQRLSKRLQDLKNLVEAPSGESLLKSELLKNSLLRQSLGRFRRLDQLQVLMIQADVRWHLGTFVVLTLGVGVAGLALGFFKSGPIAGLLAGGLGLLVPYRFLTFKKKRRVKKFERQLPEALDLLSRSLKAGHALTAGLQLVSEEMPDPLGAEFFKTFKEHSHGMELNAALVNLCQRVDLQDLRFFATAVMIQRETGGNLADILEKISALIRERFKLRNQIKALTAEGRLSGWILVLMSPVIALLLFYMNPQYELLLVRHPLGYLMAVGAMISQLLGMLAIRKIVNIKV